MLRLLTRKARKLAPGRPRSFRPALEWLERRDCPAGPSITIFSVTAAIGKTAMVSGTVMESGMMPPSGVSVVLTGVISANLTTDANGNFSGTEPASALGTLTATATDSQGLTSAPAQAQLTAAAPTVSVQVTVLDHRNVLLTGTVAGPSPGGLTVTFGGEVSGTAVTKFDGTFSVELQASALGSVSASTVDVWGQASNTATAAIQAVAPSILGFQATQNGTIWIFSGTVNGNSAAGETVTFGGLPQLQGQTCTVNSNGTFSFSITLPAGIDSTATAFVTDWWGQQSDTADAPVVS